MNIKRCVGGIMLTIMAAFLFIGTQNATKEDYEVPVTLGPGTGIKIDMSSISKGMSFTINPFTIPVKYERYPDGRSVIGIGINSTDASFWEDAANDNFQERISKLDMYQK